MAQIQAKVAEVYHCSVNDIADLEASFGSPDPYEGIEILIEDDDAQSLEELLLGTDEPPAIRLVNSILLEAIRLGASDIHIQPRAKNVMVRLRIDGVLIDKIQIPHNMHQSIVSRIKVMAELDISGTAPPARWSPGRQDAQARSRPARLDAADDQWRKNRDAHTRPQLGRA